MYENNKLTNPLFLILSRAVHVSPNASRSGFIMQKLITFHCCLVRNDKFLTVHLNSSSVEYIKHIKAWKCTENMITYCMLNYAQHSCKFNDLQSDIFMNKSHLCRLLVTVYMVMKNQSSNSNAI